MWPWDQVWPMRCKGKFCAGIVGRLLKGAGPLQGASRAFPPVICWLSSFPGTPVSALDRLLFSRSVVSDSLRPRGLRHARLACPSPAASPQPETMELPKGWETARGWWSRKTALGPCCLESHPPGQQRSRRSALTHLARLPLCEPEVNLLY